MRRVLAMLVCAAFCHAALAAGEVRVFAAASFTEALRQIALLFERQASNRVILNLGASSMLARQIEEGAPCDVFISADMEQIQKLAAKKLVEPGSHRLVASNSLVIVTERGNPLRISAPAGLAAARRIALAETRTVPAGVFARRFLEQRGLWAAIQPKVVPTQNVRGALAAVESGNADAAIVYKTDARMARDAEVAFEVPAAETPYIASSAAVPATARNPREAREFLEFLQSEPAAAVLRHFGFVVPAKPANL